MLHAVAFRREIRAGSSLPLVVDADDGGRYVLRAHGSGEGPLASVVEWIALRLGGALGLPVPEPHPIRVEPGLVPVTADPEVRELAERSVGTNLATRWVEDARPAGADDLVRLAPETRRDLFLFDLLLLNVDRTLRNPNAIVGAGGLLFLDFSAAVALRALATGASADEAAPLGCLRLNPLHEGGIDPAPFAARLRGLERDRLRGLAAEPPGTWLRAADPAAGEAAVRRRIADGLEALMEGAGEILRRRLAALGSVRPEEDGERLRRAFANRDAFRRRFGGR